jgi:hypothetical protein
LLDDSRPSLAGDIRRTVPGAVVNNDDLADEPREPDPLEGFGDADPDAFGFVQTRHDYRNIELGRRRGLPTRLGLSARL